ncbi:MAG: thiamine-monophosphate kinase [Planctomycetota bacterium]|nr:MAG: thiamine-monophosphate kinase [Planctomycetota bacterium]
MFDAVARTCDRFCTALVGGDTTVWPFPLAIATTAIGEPGPHGVVGRGGARPGDQIFVTGALGGSRFGHHLTFVPRIGEALDLAAYVELHAMCDISDGLAIDLHHIAEESGVGAVIEAEAIPVRPEAARHADGRSALDHALSDGEDFELLFCVSPRDAERLEAFRPCLTPLTRIGEITADRRVLLRHPDGRLEPLPKLGWHHVLRGRRD